MNCNFVQSRISSYVDGELPGDEMIAIRRHVDACTSCAQEFGTFRGIKRVVATLPEREASPDLEARVLAAVRTAARPVPGMNTWWPSGRMAIALAAAAVAMFCVMMLRGSGSPDGPAPGNEIALDQDWNNARSVFPASNLPAGLEGP
jgi:anti-sigma factor (TIGR02949 family)